MKINECKGCQFLTEKHSCNLYEPPADIEEIEWTIMGGLMKCDCPYKSTRK